MINLKIKPKKISEETEQKLGKIIDEFSKEHKYIKLDENAKNELRKAVSKHKVSFRMVLSLRRAIIREKVILRHGKLRRLIKVIQREYEEKKDKDYNIIINLSNKYEFSPLNIFRVMFESKNFNKNKIKIILKNPDNYLDKIDTNQVKLAIKYDLVSSVDQELQSKLAEEFERDIEKILKQKNIKYKTQEELVKEQFKKYGKPIITPDFLIESDLYINRHKVNWIDAKNFYGANLETLKYHLEKQVAKYIKAYGDGLLVFKYGFSEKIKINNVSLL